MLNSENFTFMKSSLLNPEIYNKVNDSATSRDSCTAEARRLLFKSTIPLVKVVVALKELEQDTITRDVKRKLHDVSLLLLKNPRVNNFMLTEIQRKSGVCQSLGKKFKTYAQLDSSEDYLFDEKTMKRMNQDLKTIHDRSSSRNFYQHSKNSSSFYKIKRIRSQYMGKNNQYYNQRKKCWFG